MTEEALPVARFSLWAHLLKLAGEGRARGAAGDGTDPETNGLDATWRATETTPRVPLSSG